MPIPISDDTLASLRYSANKAMWTEWKLAHPAGAAIYEVSCIRNLIGCALPQVQQAWARELAAIGITATLTGHMCHGRPFVLYPGAPRACELGDFLLVHDHWPSSGGLERSAAIVQAKIFGRNGVISRNSVQLGLYQKWPRFTYTAWPGGMAVLRATLATNVGITITTPGALEREIAITRAARASHGEIDRGCRYGMIDVHRSVWGDPHTAMNPWRLCSANVGDVYTHERGISLGGYLIRLMMGTVGRAVPYPKWPTSLPGACHWSLMIQELLSLVPPRQQATAPGTVAYLAMKSASADGGGLGGEEGPLGVDGDGAFGVILVTTTTGPDRPTGKVQG
jgi:hypothetical protein